mmetsp:Transcript_68248/g.222060  ORF Transcript_68248/g.222060 Transcript_68248/m.222060 type:complete len:230 (+) Transcript_68248:282-971(+)
MYLGMDSRPMCSSCQVSVPGARRCSKGSAKAAATSELFSTSREASKGSKPAPPITSTAPTTGVTAILPEDNTGLISPSMVTQAGSSPSSSCASRRAVAAASASPGSARPPGKQISPACALRCAARTHSSTEGRARASKQRGTKTAADLSFAAVFSRCRGSSRSRWPIRSVGHCPPGWLAVQRAEQPPGSVQLLLRKGFAWKADRVAPCMSPPSPAMSESGEGRGKPEAS